MKDYELRSQTDYSAGQREAANRVLLELVNILNDYQDEILVIGGWVPDLLFPEQEHVGSIDVDLLIDHLSMSKKDQAYLTIERILINNGYIKHTEKYFTYVKQVTVGKTDYVVEIDIMAGMYGGTKETHRSQRIQGVRALKATGGNFAFEVPPNVVKIEARRSDGALDTGHVRVISIIPFLVMKTAALGRGKAKDAYDIYFCIKHYGIDELCTAFNPYLERGLVKEMIEKLNEKFSSPEHSGPTDVVLFLELIDEEEIEMMKRDVFEHVNQLITKLRLILDD